MGTRGNHVSNIFQSARRPKFLRYSFGLNLPRSKINLLSILVKQMRFRDKTLRTMDYGPLHGLSPMALIVGMERQLPGRKEIIADYNGL